MKKDGGKELPPKPGQRRSRGGISPLYTILPGPQPPYRYFRALPRTRLSNTPLRIAVCAVWNGFTIVCASQQRPSHSQHTHLDVQLPHLHQKRPDPLVVLRLVQQHELHIYPGFSGRWGRARGTHLLPGVTKADTVHSLNLSTALRYLRADKEAQAHIARRLRHTGILTCRYFAARPLRSRPSSRSQSSE